MTANGIQTKQINIEQAGESKQEIQFRPGKYFLSRPISNVDIFEVEKM